MAESAAQLFARLGAKEQLGDLHLPLFSHLPGQGLKPGDVVELCGSEGSGKTEILLNVTAHCVLPKSWKTGRLPGRNVEVVYISTDYKLDLSRLVAILEGKVCGDNPGHHSRSKDAVGTSEYRKLIKFCLSRVHVLYCNSSTELVIVLHSLKTFLHTHPEVCALILDNVASYYWVDRCESVRGGGGGGVSEYRQQQWVGALGELTREYHLVVFAAKPLLFEPRERGQSDKVSGAEDFMCKQWQRLVRYRFHLQKSSPSPRQLSSVAATSSHTQHELFPTFSAHMIHPPGGPLYKFVVHQDGVKFIQ